MCMCLNDHLDAKELKQDKYPLEIPLDFEEDVFDDEVQRNEAIPLSGEEIALVLAAKALRLREDHAALNPCFNVNGVCIILIMQNMVTQQSSQASGGAMSSKASGGNNYSRLLKGLKAHTKKARNDPTTSSEFWRYVNSDFVTRLHPKEFATFDVLGFLKENETMFLVLSRMAMDLISVQASLVSSESAFSTSGRVLSIRRTRLTPASLEMCMCLKNHLDAKERKQDKCPLEIPLDFEEDVFDDEVQRNEAIPLSDEEIALDASSEGTLSPGGPRYDYMMSSEAEDDY
nr:transposase [Tanacetum cinerariifolium]